MTGYCKKHNHIWRHGFGEPMCKHCRREQLAGFGERLAQRVIDGLRDSVTRATKGAN